MNDQNDAANKENMLILGEKNLIRVAEIRGCYISDKNRGFLRSDNDTIRTEWHQCGLFDPRSIRESMDQVFFAVDSKNVYTNEFVAELVAKKGTDWKDFYPDIYTLAEATHFINRLDEKYRSYLFAMKPLFEELNTLLQHFLHQPLGEIQSAIAACLARFPAVGLSVSQIIFEHRLFVQDTGKQIKIEVARVFYQQYTNFRIFFLSKFNINVHALVFHEVPFSTGVSVVMNTLGNGYTSWNEKDLMCFPIDHILCPKFRVLTAQESRDIYNEQGTEGKMQLLQHTTDPISKIYGLVAGNLIEIVRDLDFLRLPSSEMVAYRFIIK